MAGKILVIDLETTGFLDKGGKIVEVGIVELDLTNSNTTTLFDELCHERPITKEEVESSWIIQNSSMSVEDVRMSKQLKDIRVDIQDIIDSYPLGVTAYNNKFDFGFMDNRGFTINRKLPCPMMLSVDLIKLPPLPHQPKKTKYKYPNVNEAWEYFFGKDTGYVELHRGADDAKHEAKIIYELYKLGIFKID